MAAREGRKWRYVFCRSFSFSLFARAVGLRRSRFRSSFSGLLHGSHQLPIKRIPGKEEAVGSLTTSTGNFDHRVFLIIFVPCFFIAG